MKQILIVFLLLFQMINLQAQASYSPSESLQMIQINGYRYPAPSFYNMIWLTMVPEASFVEEVNKFDFSSIETYQKKCVYFSSENDLPSAKFVIQKCNGGEIHLFWNMEESRVEKISFADQLLKELRSYPYVQEDSETVIFKIKYTKWFVFIKIVQRNGEEIISVRSSKDPQ